MSIYDFIAKPYCFFNLSASSTEIFKTSAISFVILSPPNGIVFVYINSVPSKTPISVFPAPMSRIIILSFSSFVSSTTFFSASVIGTIPSISKSAFLKILCICLIYSLFARTICAFNVNDAQKLPIGSEIVFPSSNMNFSATISIIVLFSGTSISFACIIADDTSFADIPAYLSFTSFVTLFCTIVTSFPCIVIYAEFIFKSESVSASSIVFTIVLITSSSFIIFPFLIPLHILLALQIVSI